MKILFMCVANSARSQLAEGLARKVFPDTEIMSAGSNPGQLNPYAVRVMKEIGIDISNQFSKSVNQLPSTFVSNPDFVITLCAEEVCPVIFAPSAKRLHWPFQDPATKDVISEEEMLKRFRIARDAILERLNKFKLELNPAHPQRYIAEFFGTAALLAIVAGSGIMGENLSGGNTAIALLANSIATGLGLFVLISCLGPISGAHFNPAVSLFDWGQQKLRTKDLLFYLVGQFSGALVGIILAHAMFGLSVIQSSTHLRSTPDLLISEFLATLGLLIVIQLGLKNARSHIAQLVAAYITAAYWFTSSTSFANPAVTIARSFTNTFCGIAPSSILGFIFMQLAATATLVMISRQMNRS